jgi:hypothetical protein
VNVSKEWGESLCTAIKRGLGTNETLESLELLGAPLCDDNVELSCRAFSFLRTNKAIKSLVVDMHMQPDATNSCLSTFRVAITAMLEDNTSLEKLSIRKGWKSMCINVEEYFVHVTALQHNKLLKSIKFHSRDLTIRLTEDEDKQMTCRKLQEDMTG